MYMGSIYDDYYNQAFELQHYAQDVTDNHNHPQAISLHHELHQLTEDLKSEKHPRDVEHRLKTIEHQLLEARTHGEQIMSYQDIEDLQHRYKRLRENVRRMPNY